MSEFDDFYRRLQTVGSGTPAVVAAFPATGKVGSLREIGRSIESTIAHFGVLVTVAAVRIVNGQPLSA